MNPFPSIPKFYFLVAHKNLNKPLNLMPFLLTQITLMSKTMETTKETRGREKNTNYALHTL